MSETQSKIYKISANYKKSTYQEERWVNKLKNDRLVTLCVTTFFRWGTFEISLTEKEKEDILKMENIVLNNYECSMEEMWDGCDRYIEIHNETSFSTEEIKEINRLIYCEDLNNSNYEYNSDNDEFQEDILDANGWDLDDTIYGITTGCKLENVK